MHRGYFALWRKIEDHPFYTEPREYSKLEAWLDILMHAQHEEELKPVVFGMKVLECHYGECLKSNVTWANRWKWSEAKVRRFLKLLKKMGQIRYQSEGVTTRIKIINYNIYDPRRREKDDEVTGTRRGRDEYSTTDNNDKNIERDNARAREESIPDQIYDFYLSTIDPLEKTRGRAVDNISSFLKSYDPEDLKTAIENYSTIADTRDRQYRKNPANFFGKKEKYFIDFLPGKFKPTENSNNQPPQRSARPPTEFERKRQAARASAQAYLKLKKMGVYDEEPQSDSRDDNDGVDQIEQHNAGQRGSG